MPRGTSFCVLLLATVAVDGRAQQDPYETTVHAPPRISDGWSGPASPAAESFDRDTLDRSGEDKIQDVLARAPGIELTDEQGNPAQQGLLLDGFEISPVTGLSQAVAVYLDGVRLNEPSVEQLNFELVPLEDLAWVEWTRSPAPLGGSNALGGTVQLFTRRGGRRVEAEVTSEIGTRADARVRGRLSGPLGPLGGYVSVLLFEDPGWRVTGGARGVRAFGKLGLSTDSLDTTLSYQFQKDKVQQPGSLPESLLAQDRRANYTAGDRFIPVLHLLTLNVRGRPAAGVTLSGTAFLRIFHGDQANANLVDPDTDLTERTTSTGVRIEADGRFLFGSFQNRWLVGAEASADWVGVSVQQLPNSEFSEDEEGRPLPRLAAELSDRRFLGAIFVSDRLELVEGALRGLSLEGVLRLDNVTHDIVDTTPDAPGAATARRSYTRLVPAVTLAKDFARRWTLSVSYGQGFRAPAFLELTCAEPSAPCIGLQAGLAPDASDANLRPVVSQTFAAGVRGTPLDWLSLKLWAFRTDLRDDIFGQVLPGGTEVFFQNIERTRRQGIVTSLGFSASWASLELSYSFVRATFEGDAVLATARTPEGTEQVKAGNLLPLSPVHRGSATGWIKPFHWLTMGLSLSAVGPQFLRGDAANVTPRLSGYAVLDASAEGRWGAWSAGVTVRNLLGTDYETFGTYAPDARLEGAPVTRFLNPGAPRHVLFRVGWRT